jgi:anti-sigma B factor antagonist
MSKTLRRRVNPRTMEDVGVWRIPCAIRNTAVAGATHSGATITYMAVAPITRSTPFADEQAARSGVFYVVVERSDLGVVCALHGDLDTAASCRLREALAELCGAAAVVLDLSGVPFIDAAGLRVLVAGIRRCHAHGAEVVIRGIRPPVERLVRLAGLDQVAPFVGKVGRSPSRRRPRSRRTSGEPPHLRLA